MKLSDFEETYVELHGWRANAAIVLVLVGLAQIAGKLVESIFWILT